jgi:hypothetical protein
MAPSVEQLDVAAPTPVPKKIGLV